MIRPLFLAIALAACAGPPTPREIYVAEYVGSYGQTNLCLGEEVNLDLTPTSVIFRETACEIGAVTPARFGLTLDLVECRAGSVAIPNFDVTVAQTSAGLSYASPTENLLLDECTDR
ncbi:hypothetical protein JQU17_00270 [Ponticoccus sp. SC2-23]|uniref:hypothetical protein n=1 Tax=Alexandriicola marinus TaxID=2081710 RepID=UPI000FD9FB2B|nr:hypothetical protein [Alexandriicola marinus]MBM1218612.1 hypothetical protein [Ponticoccus sp. SC6-9]MBM1224316.1 hypothetical protein [Ponticoccus sp. SC6-15]MBM1229905.1 hypothetical protein [Ponticoccus sp. SC6-38]MBM1233282.1 hypothetical protein [Ponticoccus sp. SC6-45]MBM1236768.1 hypothetical protein [Ponticoccus sp. SC6-49]MBM1242293.1 hypothetical protein [Ponticoccus sp. SC2-64]MBM1246806.1 hypothetical protein [Ponticoccus sp. SC6-42]MBM1251284.1 hypothetical protein [Pontico